MESILGLYQIWKGQSPVACEKLPGAGSNRRYYRLTDDEGKSVIGCTGTSREENEAFIYLTKHFAEKGLPVPMILAISMNSICSTCRMWSTVRYLSGRLLTTV